MKNLHFTNLLAGLIFITSISFAQEPREGISGDFLLKTQWGSDELTSRFSPSNEPLGCHSIAIAQVLYYHKLAPTGAVNYKCSNGHDVKEDFTSYKVAWDKISDKLTSSSSKEAIDATAYFNYAVACIVQKDFATDNYIDIEKSENHKLQIEKHFSCQYGSYTFPGATAIADLFKNKTFDEIIKKEIDAKRPVGFYYMWDQGGHAVVVDGYIVRDGNFYVHANFGWMGHSDGWYLLPEDMPDSTSLILLLTIDPVI